MTESERILASFAPDADEAAETPPSVCADYDDDTEDDIKEPVSVSHVAAKNEAIAHARALVAPELLKPGKIDDKTKLKRLHMAGLNHDEIAEFFGVSRVAVTKMVGKMGLEAPKYTPEEFKGRMEHEMLDRMNKLLGSMSADKIASASLSQLIMAFGILYDKVRLQRGESTQNVAALNVHKLDPKALEAIKAVIDMETTKKLVEARKSYSEVA